MEELLPNTQESHKLATAKHDSSHISLGDVALARKLLFLETGLWLVEYWGSWWKETLPAPVWWTAQMACFPMYEPCFFETGRICVRKNSQLSSSTSVYSCGLHLSKLISKQWRQLKSSINSIGHKHLDTNTLCLITFYPFLCWRQHTGHWILQESVNMLRALLFIILLPWVSVGQAPFWFMLLPCPSFYFFELKYMKRDMWCQCWKFHSNNKSSCVSSS